ncbi:GNAT family N-acetyltransferase [Candidatus Pacearchaeota archaeon]|nr:GNAT family N-acetyltransferase [Candidatus Pacearchaeota archaeon]
MIRKAIVKDIEKINEIYSEGAFQEYSYHHGKKSEREIRDSVNEEINNHKKKIRRDLQAKKQYWVVLEDKGKVIGFGSVYLWSNKGVVGSVYISKNYQNKGYGTKILKYLTNWMKSKKVKRIESNLLVGNVPSIKLHKKLGFEPYLLRMRLK